MLSPKVMGFSEQIYILHVAVAPTCEFFLELYKIGSDLSNQVPLPATCSAKYTSSSVQIPKKHCVFGHGF
jgi:hypothetical protein